MRCGSTHGILVPRRMISTCGNRAEPGDDPFQHEVGQHQRVAPGKDDVAHLGMRGDVVDAVLDVLHVDLGRIADLPLARAETAIHGTLARGQEQDAVRIAVNDARHRAVAVFGEGIFGKTVFFQLLPVGNALQPDGIAGIADQAEVVRVDPDMKQFVQPVRQIRVEPESLHEVLPAVDALPQHFLPEFHWCLCSSSCYG